METQPNESIVNPELLAILVCPVDHAEVVVENDGLRCTSCGRFFPVEDGIPNMLVEEID